MKKCVYCGKENKLENRFCSECGEQFIQQGAIIIDEETGKYEEKTTNDNNFVKCPKCGSNNIAFVTTQGSGVDGSNACCGYILFGPLGLLCGLTGNKESKTVRKCMVCGTEF